MIYMFLSNNPSSWDINSSNLSRYFFERTHKWADEQINERTDRQAQSNMTPLIFLIMYWVNQCVSYSIIYYGTF